VGDDASWKEKTEALTKAVAALETGAADAPKTFEAAANCKACHEVHKPKKK
jgi:cytochrome c2